jgi:hypothetical protein
MAQSLFGAPLKFLSQELTRSNSSSAAAASALLRFTMVPQYALLNSTHTRKICLLLVAQKFSSKTSASLRSPPSSNQVSLISMRVIASPQSAGTEWSPTFWRALQKMAKLWFGTSNRASRSSSSRSLNSNRARVSTTTSTPPRVPRVKRELRPKRLRLFGTQPSQLSLWSQMMTIQILASIFGT